MNETQIILKPESSIEQYDEQRNLILKLIREQMVEGVDYGKIPGTEKKTLFQPGAEKLAAMFGIAPKFELIKEEEDWDTGFFYYKYRCSLIHISSGLFVGDSERSCNSREKKYLYYTKPEKNLTDEDKERVIARDKKEGRYGTYFICKLKKDPIQTADDVNTLQAMAQKRAMVAAVRTATKATDIFDDSREVEPPKEQRGHKNRFQSASTGNRQQAPTEAEVVTPPQPDPLDNMRKKYFASAAQRGFSSEKAKEKAKRHFRVDSFTKLSTDDIEVCYIQLVKFYAEVPKGTPPKLIPQSKADKPKTFDEKYEDFKKKHL